MFVLVPIVQTKTIAKLSSLYLVFIALTNITKILQNIVFLPQNIHAFGLLARSSSSAAGSVGDNSPLQLLIPVTSFLKNRLTQLLDYLPWINALDKSL